MSLFDHVFPNSNFVMFVKVSVIYTDWILVWMDYPSCTFTGDICLKLQMWANAQPDGRPAEYTWRPLFNATKFG